MAYDVRDNEKVTNPEILAKMAAHIRSGHKLIVQCLEPKEAGSIVQIYGYPFQVLRESTAQQYQAEGNGNCFFEGLAHYYEIEPAD